MAEERRRRSATAPAQPDEQVRAVGLLGQPLALEARRLQVLLEDRGGLGLATRGRRKGGETLARSMEEPVSERRSIRRARRQPPQPMAAVPRAQGREGAAVTGNTPGLRTAY